MTTRGPLLGWNVETWSDQGGWEFAGFIPAPDLDAKASMLADLAVLQAENAQPSPPDLP